MNGVAAKQIIGKPMIHQMNPIRNSPTASIHSSLFLSVERPACAFPVRPSAALLEYAPGILFGARSIGASVRATFPDPVSSGKRRRRHTNFQNRRYRRRSRKESGGPVPDDRSHVPSDRSKASAESTEAPPRHSAGTPFRGQGTDLHTKDMHPPHPPWPQEQVSVARSSGLEYVLLDLVPRPP